MLFYIYNLLIAMSSAQNDKQLNKVHCFFAKKSNKMSYQRQSSKNMPFQISNLQHMKRESIDNGSSQPLKKYHGQPNLKEYLSSAHNLSKCDEYQQEGLKNRNMKRLSRCHMPNLLFLYQTIFTSYDIEQVQLVNHASNSSDQWQVRSSISKNIKTINESNNSLVVAQTLVWVRLTFDKFKTILDGNSRMVSKIFKKMIGIHQNTNDDDFRVQSNNLVKVLFRLFCLPNSEYILWPSIVLQPVVGQKQSIKRIIIDSISQEPYSYITQIEIFQDTIKQYLSNVMLKPTTPTSFTPSQKQFQVINQIIKNMNHETYHKQEFIVRLIGTNATIVQKDNLLQWNHFRYQEVHFMMINTPFDLLLSEINKIIHELNQFKKKQCCKVNGKETLYRLCKYKTQSCEFACIPVRYYSNNQQKYLIRVLEQASRQQISQFKMVQSHELSVNETLPRHNHEQRKLYNSFGSNFSIYQVLIFIYSNYLGTTPKKYINILRITYPYHEIQKKFQQTVRCPRCNYLVRSEQYLCCKFCLSRYHSCCIERQRDKNKQYLHNIYETQNDDDVWSCQSCSPCRVCYQSIADSDDFLKCKICLETYHSICGKLLDQYGQSGNKSAFICLDCLKCSVCNVPVMKIQYYIQDEKAICSSCLCKHHCGCCKKCHSRTYQNDMVSCTAQNCEIKSHKKCDSALLQLNNQTIPVNFKCEVCRNGKRRKLIEWIIEELRVFDEFEFFDDPDYEDIPEYFQVIKNPMCFLVMRSKALLGQYDSYTYQKLFTDVRLIAKNAMTFNMPREQIHFKAKILLVAGQRFLQTMKELLDYNDLEIITKQLDKIYTTLKAAFYRDLNRNFANYLLNYGKKASKIEFICSKQIEMTDLVFSSKHILINGLKNSQLRYHISVKPETIDQLFKIPKLISASWNKMSDNLCFYHPKQRLPIIFQCKHCWETYCCTKVCFKHTFCCICRKYGCCCNQSMCSCSPLRDRQRRILQKQVKHILEANSITKLEYTQYNRYCLRCVREKARTCHICKKFCYFGYQNCQQCNVVYHVNCLLASKKKSTTSETNEIKQKYFNPHFKNLCIACLKDHKQYKKYVKAQSKLYEKRIDQINECMPILRQLYDQQGIRISNQEILHLVFQNYDEFQKKLTFFRQVSFGRTEQIKNHQRKINYSQRSSSIIPYNLLMQHQSVGGLQNTLTFLDKISLARQEKDIGEIQSNHLSELFTQNLHQLFPQDQTFTKRQQQIQQYTKKSIKLEQMLQITQISFSLLTMAARFSMQLKQQTAFRKTQGLQINLRFNQVQQILGPKKQINQLLFKKKCMFYSIYQYESIILNTGQYGSLSPFNEESEFLKATRQLEKYMAISYICEGNRKSKQDLIFKRIREGFTIQYLELLGLSQIRKNILSQLQMALNISQIMKDVKQHGIRDSILSNRYNIPLYQCFRQFVPFPHQQQFKLEDYGTTPEQKISNYMKNYLANFTINIYNTTKTVLSKGNTYLIGSNQTDWKIYKKILGVKYFLRLYKNEDQNWVFVANEKQQIMDSMVDLMNAIRGIGARVNSFQQVVAFMGFSLIDAVHAKPTHFKKLLQRKEFYEMSVENRKKQVLKIYNDYEWHQDGIIQHKQTKKIAKVKQVELFFLKKRVSTIQGSVSQKQKEMNRSFITLQDLRRNVFPKQNQFDAYFEQQPKIHPNPLNDVYIAPSKIDRLGLFIGRNVAKYTNIIQYVGEIVSQAIADMRQIVYKSGCYFFTIGQNDQGMLEIIDATHYGNKARYLNHSCDSNCRARVVDIDGKKKIMIYTVRDVRKDEELTYDYQFKIESGNHIECKCGSKNCQGRLN